MPAVRTKPRDVLIRVPKIEPYSNAYVPPSVRAKKAAEGAAAAAGTSATAPMDASLAAANGATEAAANTSTAVAQDPASAAPTSNTNAATLSAATGLALSSAPTQTDPLKTADSEANSADKATDATGEDAEKDKDRTERGNSPIIPFMTLEREESQTVELSKAATSSAGWNSLLIWARRQRGPQWDSGTALWQVDKNSEEYYSFCRDPAQTKRSTDPTQPTSDASDNKNANPASGPGTVTGTGPAAEADDDDKGPTRFSSRIRDDPSATNSGNNSPPPVSHGRTIRLVRR
ncbi:hypothetical protein BCV70DRAFT_56743 [Testicularia cyperi]|uniref:Uncharacterized protein n=1 Tax=Testicularia cyperi TaxID=1882483 RepID=A0A317XXP8_9BASI|nr:hypothetical protein BCV70DRAFT_56743 [Testicularia cyperi]